MGLLGSRDMSRGLCDKGGGGGVFQAEGIVCANVLWLKEGTLEGSQHSSHAEKRRADVVPVPIVRFFLTHIPQGREWRRSFWKHRISTQTLCHAGMLPPCSACCRENKSWLAAVG